MLEWGIFLITIRPVRIINVHWSKYPDSITKNKN